MPKAQEPASEFVSVGPIVRLRRMKGERMNDEGIPFAQAVAKTLEREGASVLDEPNRFMSFLCDYTSDEGLEMRVLTNRCDAELLAIYKDAISNGSNDLQRAAAMAADLLVSQYIAASDGARSTSEGIARGIAIWQGKRYGAAPAPAAKPVRQVDPEALGLVRFDPSSSTKLGGYRIIGELSAQNAGLSRWGACEKGGTKYFIKEFLSPVYPVDRSGLTAATAARREKLCEQFFNERRIFYRELALCQTGNIVAVRDFFRSDAKYYAVSDWVESSGIGFDQLCRMDTQKKLLLCNEILYNVAALHARGIVHADLKPDNLLLKATRDGFVTAKLIDFDGSFLVGHVPAEIQGDFVYMAPEVYRRMNGENVPVTEKVDVFALGIILHQLWTGATPHPAGTFKYAFEAALNGAPIVMDPRIPQNVSRVLQTMLAPQGQARPGVAAVFSFFSNVGRVLS